MGEARSASFEGNADAARDCGSLMSALPCPAEKGRAPDTDAVADAAESPVERGSCLVPASPLHLVPAMPLSEEEQTDMTSE